VILAACHGPGAGPQALPAAARALHLLGAAVEVDPLPLEQNGDGLRAPALLEVEAQLPLLLLLLLLRCHCPAGGGSDRTNILGSEKCPMSLGLQSERQWGCAC
jgi:hypothetical protein